ncbi:MAG: transporter permease subunit [Glaciihabitans sp.]|nr:transporter permease subunit [Glaciihabitans sp.]
MTTTIPSTTAQLSPGRGLTFGGILASEWIKLRTLRSTVWCYAAMVVVTVALGLLIASVFGSQATTAVSGAEAQNTLMLAATASVGFSQLIACVLGVLVITGEYGTGMIRSTFTAVPRRLPALAAKILVFAVVTFLVSAVAVGITALIAAPILSGAGVEVDLADSGLLLSLLGAALYLTLIGVLSLTIGAIIRNSAGGIAAAIGLVLVVPTLLQILGGLTQSTFAINLASFTPSESGSTMYTYGETPASSGGFISLDPTQGGLVLVAWVLVLAAVAGVTLKRRDV